MDERVARIALACLVEPGEAWISDHLAERGVESALRYAMAKPGIPARGRVLPDDVPAMLASLPEQGVRVLVLGDAEFPSQLQDLSDPPMALWVKGPLDIRISALRSASIVGARACTAYGERATAEVAAGLAQRGWAVVSGAAFGIDAAAHRAALAVDGPTIAVLACGIDLAYPRAHESLLHRISDVGAVVSELPPGSAPLKHRFLARNRLIAALSRGTIVVEAAHRSGALATANRALEIGRELMAVPGPITSMASAGPNRLLHQGLARAVSNADEVESLLLSPGELPSTEGQRTPKPEIELNLEMRAILDALSVKVARTVDQVAKRTDLDPVSCTAQLGVLELMGKARRGVAGWQRSA